jgi:hypothetical protein
MTQSNPVTIEATSFPIPSETPETFYRALIAGVLTPGVIPPDGVTDWDIVTDWDVKKGKGINDATLTNKGNDPPTGKIKYQVWRKGYGGDPNDFDEDDSFVTMLLAAQEKGDALDITHPFVNQARVEAVVTKKIGQLKDEGGGLFTRTIEFLKWVEQPKTVGTGTPSGASDKMAAFNKALQHNLDVAKGIIDQGNDPNAALKKEFEDKVKEAQEAPEDDGAFF